MLLFSIYFNYPSIRAMTGCPLYCNQTWLLCEQVEPPCAVIRIQGEKKMLLNIADFAGVVINIQQQDPGAATDLWHIPCSAQPPR
jgi:hypothetical protein